MHTVAAKIQSQQEDLGIDLAMQLVMPLMFCEFVQKLATNKDEQKVRIENLC